jgi:hypothetical protein
MNPYESLITTAESGLRGAFSGGGAMGLASDPTSQFAQTINNAAQAPLDALKHSVQTSLDNLLKDFGPLFIGLGLFALGSAMIVFSSFEDIAQALQKAAPAAAKALVEG